MLWRFYILSNPDNLNRDSPYLAARNNRFKINNLVGFGETEKNNGWCLPCHGSGLNRLIPSPKPDEKGKLYCRNCGKSYSIDDINKTKPTQNLAKPQQASGPFVISQKRKEKRVREQIGSINDTLSPEDIDDIRARGVEPS
jgi:uncharacterized protein YbaR (Trm112 family)